MSFDMTQKEMMARIRALGLTVRVRDGEIRVAFPGDEAGAYYTTDRSDAVATAKIMVERKQRYASNPRARDIGDHVHNYWTAERFLAGRQERRLANNTTVIRRSADSIAVRLHATDIVTYYLDGRVRLRSGGWQTVTTKQRINELLPPGLGISQRNRQWYLVGGGSEQPFVDGMIVDTGVERRASNPPRKRKYLRMGTISEGTLRPEDVIPAYLGALDDVGGRKRYPDLYRECDEVLAALEADEEPDADPGELIDSLHMALEENAPPYTYVGGSTGDGADLGVWPDYESASEADDVIVQDDSRGGRYDELPKGFTGYLLSISDHGNASLYEYKRGRNLGDVW